MLLNNFYFVREQEDGEGSVKARIEFDVNHSIFAGHFPSVPVVPGVCMMQIIREMVQKIIGSPVRLTKVPVMKFLSLINPKESPSVRLDISFLETPEKHLQVTASLFNEGIIYFKFKGVAAVLER